MNDKYKRLYEEIKKFDIIYIARHVGPDPDSHASQVSLRESIKLTFPKKKVVTIGSSVSKFKFMGDLDKPEKYDYENSLLIALDVPDKKRVEVDSLEKFKNILKFDHHPTIDKFSKLDVVNDKSSSTCEMIYELIENTNLKMNKEIAICIFCGIVSDTNRFLFRNTTSKSFEISNELIKKYKIDTEELYNQIYSRPLSEIRLMGHIASTLRVTENGFAYIYLDDDIVSSFGNDLTVSNLINDFSNIDEIHVWVFVSYDSKNDLFKVNMRSNGPIINKYAEKYGGGGHRLASGLKTKSKEDVDSLLKELDKLCRDYKE